jgi:pimeloyl-ACP methyl ester carboxylesterase
MTSLRPGDARYVEAAGLRFACLEQGPADGPLALCLHGFPDHARTWRHLLPRLADAGFRAVAPWMRGYAPTEVPDDGRFDVATLGSDVNALHDALDGDERAVVIGHDWGALAAYSAAAAQQKRWSAVVGLAVPPEPALTFTRWEPWQMRRSWYIGVFQIPGAERLVEYDDFAFVRRLWRTWSPGHEPDVEDFAALKATLRSPGTLSAALGYYRALRTQVLRFAFSSRAGRIPRTPTLYLHGRRDGCIGLEYAVFARIVFEELESAQVEIIDDAGHFLHLERSDVVFERIMAFVRHAAEPVA